MSWTAGVPLRVGDEVEERTRLVGAVAKKSRDGGEMVLVEVEKEFWGPRGRALVDRRSWVFRPPPKEVLARTEENVAGFVPGAVGKYSSVEDLKVVNAGECPSFSSSASPPPLSSACDIKFRLLKLSKQVFHNANSAGRQWRCSDSQP